MLSVQEILSYKKMRVNHQKTKDLWCDEQVQDCQKIYKMVEELIISAVGANHSMQQYEQLLVAKDNFMKELLEINERYRHVD